MPRLPGIWPRPPALIDPSVLADLRSRIDNVRLVDLPAADGWSLGVDTDYLQELLSTWAHDYDWRLVEDRIRSLPWEVAGHPDTPLRMVHQRAATDDAAAVVLLHGWPDSVMRFEKVLPLLTDVHVVVPALPGNPFAAPTTTPVKSAAAMAEAVAAAMADLGYNQYVVSAGDVGTDIAESLAARHSKHVAGLHLTDLSHHHALNNPPADLSGAETATSSGFTGGTPTRAATTINSRPNPTPWPSVWATHPPGWPPGSLTSSTAGRTAQETSTRCHPRRRAELDHRVLGHRNYRDIVRAVRAPRTATRIHRRADRVHPVPSRHRQRATGVRGPVSQRPIMGRSVRRRPLRRLGTASGLPRRRKRRTGPPPTVSR